MQILIQRMRTTKLFGNLSERQLTELLESCEMRSANAGAILVRPDEPLRDFMVLVEGELEIQRTWTVPGEHDRSYTWRLTPGDAEEGLAYLNISSCGLRVRVLSAARYFLIDGRRFDEMLGWRQHLSHQQGADFDELVQPKMIEEIAPEAALDLIRKGGKWLDCRYGTEFDASRMPGARHIPLHKLRRRMHELDADTDYIVYCNTGRRSKVAAFLLRERNINAKVLIGGIRSWPYEMFVRFKKKFDERFGEWVIRYRWWSIVITLLVVMGAASGIRFLTFNNDTRVFFSEENPQLRALEALENTYNRIDNVLFVISPKDGNVFTRKTLAAVEALTAASWEMPFSSRVDSITNFQHTRAEEDDLIVENLVENAESLTRSDLQRIQQIAFSEPLLINRLISPTGHVTGVNVNILLPGKSLEEVTEVAAFARNIMYDFRGKHPDIDLYLSGGVMFDNAFGEASQNDLSTLVPAMFLMILIITGVTLRSIIGTFTTLLIIVFSMITGMGFAGWSGISLNTASVNAPTLILTLAVADSIHILTTMFQQMKTGKTKHEAVVESIRVNLQPVFLTSITTAIGFLTMNFSDAPPFRDLGNIVAIGVTAAFIYSVLFLPALMVVLPVRVKAKPEKAAYPLCDRLADFVINRRKPLFWWVVVVAGVLIAGITRTELHDDWIRYFAESYDIRRATDFAEENLTGFNVIEYSLKSGETAGINSPEYLMTVDKFTNWYRRQPKVVNVNSITDTMKRLNKNMHGDDEAYYSIPKERALAAQYLLLYEMSLPFGLDLNNQINVDKSATRLIVTLKRTTTRELREMDEKARQWLKANVPESMFTYGSGLSIIWAHLSERNINSMLGASFWALVLISGILIIALGNFKIGVLSIIPNLTPALMAFGIWGFLVGKVGIALSVVAAMTLGIVVDDTVHFMSKYLRARREYGMNPPTAVRYSFNTVGTAMIITTAALVGGFIILSFSGFRMNSDMAIMAAITLTLALALDFLFLPVLLLNVEEKKNEANVFNIEPIPDSAAADSSRNA